VALKTVKVPAGMEPLFAKAEELVSRFFRDRRDDPARGTIEIFGERYVLVRAASLSCEFFGTVEDLYGDERQAEADAFARNLLFDLAHAIGKSDAQNFHKRMGLEDPIAKLSAGPVHFAFAGWAFVDIHPESAPSPDDNYFLVYDHPYSFESDAWMRAGKRRDFPACIMNSGYSSGWCEESFGVTLVASEILCRARGDDCCRFVMAHPARIEELVSRYIAKDPDVAAKVGRYEIPDFFARKRAEEELRNSHAELERRVEARTAELRASEQQLRQAQKLEAVGRLAGGIAHDFNNLMSVILARGGMLTRRLGADDPMRREIGQIIEAAERAANLTQQLLTFSRSQVIKREPVELGGLVASLAQALLPLIGEDIELVVRAHQRPTVVDADRGQLEQVLMNLVVNARDAMPDGGVLTVELGREQLRTPLPATTGVLAAGEYVTLTVTDTGIGMEEAIVADIFDPFFTTKESGKGSGLGLSTVCGVVQQIGGEIVVATAPARGSKFTLYLPSSNAQPAAHAPAQTGATGGRETILLVEDQDALRTTLRDVLTDYGYVVHTAPDGATALALLEAHVDEISILITDVVMPKMGGRDLANAVLARRPGLPVLFVSGYAPDEQLRRSAEDRTVAFLQKPFLPEQLARAVRELLATA
jgi:two-component system, cell cycle sensor histidine kinase and response regulator CckA